MLAEYENNDVASAGSVQGTQDNPPFLHRRGEIYYFKRKIPAKLRLLQQPCVEQVWKSLETNDLDLALRKHAIELRDFEAAMQATLQAPQANERRALICRARGEGTTKYLLIEHIPFLLERYEHLYDWSGDDDRTGATAEALAEDKAYEAECLAYQKYQYAIRNFSCMEETANWRLAEERLIAPPGSKVRDELLRQLLACDIRIMEEQIRRMNGEGGQTLEKIPVGPRELPTLLDAFTSWSATQETVRTIDTYKGFVAEFESLCGALPIQAIKVEHVVKYRDHLSANNLWRQTVKNHVGGLATLVRFHMEPEVKAKNRTHKNVFDFVDFDVVRERPQDELRRAFEVSELSLLMQSAIYTQGYSTEGQAAELAYWAPLMGPFVGARVEEVAQLRMEDIQCINGQWALRIANLGPDQKIKSPSSYRMVPMHVELIRCGFLAYVARQKLAGHERVFPSLKNDNKHRRWANAFGKWHSAYLDAIELTDARLSYHSNRYTFKQRLAVCDVDEEVRDALTGHWLTKSRQAAGRGYMRCADNQYRFSVLVDAMKRLRYDELDLSHLHVAQPFKGVEILLKA